MASLLLRVILRAVLPIINKVHSIAHDIKPLEGSSIISVEIRHHRGCPVQLEDGCEVKPGDPVIKLHLNNAWIAEGWKSSAGSGMRGFPHGLFYYFKDGLRLLATEVAQGKHGGIVAVYGWTTFHTNANLLGFEVVDLPNTLRVKLAQLHITTLMQAHHIPWLNRPTASHKALQVKAVWLSRAKLLRIHGSTS